jgi:dsDNA-binding SOS-regulon protein
MGIFSGSSKTFSSIATFTLLEKDIHDKQSRKASLYAAKGDMDVYLKTYTEQRRKYRRNYSKKRLVDLGFAPSSDGFSKVLNTALALDFIVLSDVTATTFLSYSFSPDSFTFTYLDNVGISQVLTGSLSTLPSSLFITRALDFSAVIPLKEDNEIKEEGTELRKMLKLLGLEFDDLLTTLDNDDIDNAYVAYGVPLNTKTQGSIQLLYNIFNTIVPDADGLDISFGNVSWKYLFNVSKTTSASTLGKLGTYTSEVLNNELILTLQKTRSTKETLIIKDYSVIVTISGQTNSYDLSTVPDKDNGDSYSNRFIIPLNYLQGLRYKDFTIVHEESLVMIAYSVQTVKVAWYQTGLFKILTTVVAIAFQVFSGVPVITAVSNLLIATATSMLIATAGDLLGLPDWVVNLVTIAISINSMEFGSLLKDPDFYYKMLDLGGELTNVYTQYKMDELNKEKEAFDIEIEEYQEKLESLKEEWSDTTGVGFYPPMEVDLDYVSKSPLHSSSIEQMVYSKICAKYDEISNLYEITDTYQQKISIHSGM